MRKKLRSFLLSPFPAAERTVPPAALKLVGLAAMTLSHLDQNWLNDGMFFSPIGRAAFPVFAFLVAFNLAYYRCFGKYMKRMLITGAVSLPVLWYGDGTVLPLNIMFTLAAGVLCIALYARTAHMGEISRRLIFTGLVLCPVLPLMRFVDYNFVGVLYIPALYAFLKRPCPAAALPALALGFMLNLHSGMEAGVSGMISTLLLMLFAPRMPGFSSRRGFRPKWWIFYAYYPLHLLAIFMLSAAFPSSAEID